MSLKDEGAPPCQQTLSLVGPDDVGTSIPAIPALLRPALQTAVEKGGFCGELVRILFLSCLCLSVSVGVLSMAG